MTKGLARIVTAGAIALAMAVVPVSAAMAAPSPQHHSGESAHLQPDFSSSGESDQSARFPGPIEGLSDQFYTGVTIGSCVADVFLPGSRYVVEGVGTFAFVAQHGNEIKMVLVAAANGDPIDPSSKLGEDAFFFILHKVPYIDCWQLVVDYIAVTNKAIQDEAKKYPPQSTLDLNGVDLGNPDLSGALNNSGDVNPTTQTPSSSNTLTTPEGAPCTGPLGQPGVIRSGQCYLGTAM